ncbi:MAG: four helix bundle protein [Proteobacteria bacterium]|nr:four helix bundle protein [Pseudomonadota bacterium]MBU1545093.1 four helix bundle protein [Pseudomonadota bacterium]
MKYTSFEDLPIWQKARELAKFVFVMTSEEPFSKDFRFRDQIRASAGSIADNIAEGFERSGNKEFVQFLYIAKGSCGETRSQSYRARDFNYITQETLEQLNLQTTSLSAEIANFIKYLKNSGLKGYKYKNTANEPTA